MIIAVGAISFVLGGFVGVVVTSIAVARGLEEKNEEEYYHEEWEKLRK